MFSSLDTRMHESLKIKLKALNVWRNSYTEINEKEIKSNKLAIDRPRLPDKCNVFNVFHHIHLMISFYLISIISKSSP